MRTKVTRTDKYAGMSLLEVLGYLAVVGVVINLAASVFISSSRLSVLCTAALDKVVAIEEIHDGFTTAVHESSRVCTGVGEYRTGAGHVVLEMAQVSDEEDTRRYVVFGPIGSDSRLSRLVIVEQDGTSSVESFSTYRQELDWIRFSYDSDDVERTRMVAMKIEPKEAVDRGMKRPPYTFVAAMRAVAAGDGGGRL